MATLDIYDTKGNKYSPTDDVRGSNEQIKELFYSGVRFAVETGRQNRITVFFRARESRNARSEQFYARYETRESSNPLQSFARDLKQRVESEWGYTIDESSDEMDVYRQLTRRNSSLPGSKGDHRILESLLKSRKSPKVGVNGTAEAFGVVEQYFDTCNRVAIADSEEGDVLSDFDLVVVPGRYTGIEPLGNTAQHWDQAKQATRKQSIDEEINAIRESVQTLSQEYNLSNSEIRNRVQSKVPALSGQSTGGRSRAEQLARDDSSDDSLLPENVMSIVATGLIVVGLLLLIGIGVMALTGTDGGDVMAGDGDNETETPTVTPTATPTETAQADSIEDGSISGQVVDVDGDPISNETVTIRDLAGDFETNVTTDESGSFETELVEADEYTLSASVEGYNSYSEEDVTVDGNITDLEFTVEELNVLVGSVVDTDGEPIQSATVTMTLDDETIEQETNETGDYRVDGLSAGTWDVTISADGFEEESTEIELSEDSVTEDDITLEDEGTEDEETEEEEEGDE